jgi:hypothetical protein
MNVIKSLFSLTGLIAFVLGVFLSGWVMSLLGRAKSTAGAGG